VSVLASATTRPAEVLAHVEGELRTFWSTPPTAGQAPRTRACTMNLIVVAPTPEIAADWVPVLDEVLLALPARGIVVGMDPTAVDGLTASVSAVCAPATDGVLSVCSERVALVAGGAVCARAWSCIGTLSAADVPTTLVWLGPVRPDDPEFALLAGDASRIVLDTSQSSLDSLGAMVSWTRELSEADRPGIADLTWTHLGSWQELCARLFDEPRLRSLASYMTRVTVAQASPAHAPLAPETALFFGWLGTRLGWKVLVRNGKMEVTRSDDRPLQVDLRAEPGRSSSGALVSVRLEAEAEGVHLRGEIALTPGGDGSNAAGEWHLEVMRGREAQHLEQLVRLGEYRVARLLERTLRRPAIDTALVEAVAWAAPLSNVEI
jgi:glucose-6-phosphate dehydrogenase assembly protein OpcA